MRADTVYLTTAELAVRWKASTWSISQWAKAGRITKAVKFGREWRFPLDAELLVELGHEQQQQGQAASDRPTALSAIPELDVAFDGFFKSI